MRFCTSSVPVKTVVTWGLSDHDSWITHYSLDEFRRPDGMPPRPLPFDRSMEMIEIVAHQK